MGLPLQTGSEHQMSRIAYVNGHFARITDPAIHIQDRGYQFSDGVYEVFLVINGQYWDYHGHMARLKRSLAAMQIGYDPAPDRLIFIIRELLRRNRLSHALVYIQITRGVAERGHAFPARPVLPFVVITARRFDLTLSDRKASTGSKAILCPDIRWLRADIKSISLLPNALAKQQANEVGAYEAIFERDGMITEGSSSNVWLVDQDGALHTTPLSHAILGGITRSTLMECARLQGRIVHERHFTRNELMKAQEVFVSSATSLAMPIVEIDGQPIGEGKPGSISLALREAYKKEVVSRADLPRDNK